jgi:peroxiredoxin
MAEVYQKCSSFTDFGTVRLEAHTTRGLVEWDRPYSVALVRPNKLRLELNDGIIVTDGRQWNAWIRDLPGQVVVRDAPKRLTMDVLFADDELGQSLSRGLEGRIPQFPLSPQLVLLLADHPVARLLAGAEEEPVLLEAGKIGDAACYRVQLGTPDGVTCFWIDEKTFVLRRMTFPTKPLWELFGGEKEVQSLSLAADFTGAELDAAVKAEAFQFEVPKGAEQVKMFLRPNMFQLLGKPIPDFKFADREGKPVTRESLAGKVVVLNFWDTSCEPCRLLLPDLEKAYQKAKSNDKLAFFAVSLDPKDVEDKAVEKVLADLRVTVPFLRDPEQQALGALRLFATPTLFVLGSDGVVEQCAVGDMRKFLAALPEKLEKLAAGKDLSKDAAARYQEQTAAAEKALDKAFQGKVAEDRSAPATLKLVPLWKAAGVKFPGNILVVPPAGPAAAGPPRIFVIDELRSVLELGSDGRLLAAHQLDCQGEAICKLRTAVGADGKRIFAVFALGGQQLFCFDENWKQILAFPDAAIKMTHDGIADVQLGDADGSGALKLYVGYYGGAGLQAVSLDGKRLWSNRTILNVGWTTLTPPDAQGRRSILSAYQSESGAVAVLDAKGDRQGEIRVPDWPIGSIVAADLRGDGRPLWSALSVNPEGQTVILGLTLEGDVLWTYPLPAGRPRQPIEPIIPGRITANGPGQWILPGCDGSIHFVAADGKPIDHFNYGAIVGGLATILVDGKPVLLIASENGLEALRIE